MKKTKIIATIGPACDDLTTIENMAKAGMNICRLNFSFGEDADRIKMIERIRLASKNTGIPIAIMQDLQGPKIRVGKLKAPVTVKEGQTITLSGNTEHKDEFYFPTTYSCIASDTVKGKTILVADGKIILEVISTDKDKKEVVCKVTEAGTILTGKGINLPYTNISLPSLTEKDIKDAIFGTKVGVDYVSLSFVRKASDVVGLRKLLKEHGSEAPIIAKIEKPEAVDNIEAIIDEVDGIMIARGDLADEIAFAKVPLVQKSIIKKANKKGKLTIIATEMLSSMIDSMLPSRAEVSDIANGVLDGADVVMLSNETAMGKHPARAVEVMATIAKEAEKGFTSEDFIQELELDEEHGQTEAICSAVAYLSYDINNEAIAVFTRTGLTPQILSKLRPECTIFAATYKQEVYNAMAFYNNVYPVLLDKTLFNTENHAGLTIPALQAQLYKNNVIKKGQRFIIITGEYIDNEWTEMNTIKIKTFS